MATLNTNQLQLPGTMLGIVRDKALDAGILGKLSLEKPTLFGPVKGATFTGVPRASIVGESEAKPADDPFQITPFTAEPIKFVIQVRASDEFKWADDDYKLGILKDLVAPAIGAGMGRAVDLIAFHGINPKTGQPSSKAPKHLSQATSTVVPGGAPTAELNQAVGLLAAQSLMPTGIATEPGYNYQLATEVYPAGHSLAGQPMYPQATFSGTQSWRGLKVESSSTVGGKPELATDAKIKAIVGDWSEVRWGFQRNFPLEILTAGDPDNTNRDLAGHNEIMFRTEAVIYVAIGNLAKFALVKEA